MRLVLQRVSSASVTVEGEVVGEIGRGWLILAGVAKGDTDEEIDKMAEKVIVLRAFADEQGKMNLSVMDVDGSMLVVSQFTLLADCGAGRRPSYTDAAAPDEAQRLYLRFVERLRNAGISVATGVFAAHMEVALVNDGPVTLLLDSRKPKT